METGLTVDPSIYQHGFGCWANGALAFADLVRGPGAKSGSVEQRAYNLARLTIDYLVREGWDFDWIVIEDQEVRDKSKARSLLVLHTAAHVLGAECQKQWPHAKVTYSKPSAWKHNQSKPACEMQCRRFLSALEIGSIVDERFRKDWRERKKWGKDFLEDSFDQWDGIAIGMSHLGRGFKQAVAPLGTRARRDAPPPQGQKKGLKR